MAEIMTEAADAMPQGCNSFFEAEMEECRARQAAARLQVSIRRLSSSCCQAADGTPAAESSRSIYNEFEIESLLHCSAYICACLA